MKKKLFDLDYAKDRNDYNVLAYGTVAITVVAVAIILGLLTFFIRQL